MMAKIQRSRADDDLGVQHCPVELPNDCVSLFSIRVCIFDLVGVVTLVFRLALFAPLSHLRGQYSFETRSDFVVSTRRQLTPFVFPS